MYQLTRKNAMRIGATLAAVASSAAMAAVDVTATTTELGEVKTAVLAIGVVVLSIAVGIKLYKWLKSAL
jgi:Inovirus Coat protein B